MVVIGIIGLLLAIAVPVSVGVVKSSQAKATEATLETVKAAIEAFQNEKPLRELGWVFDPPTGPSDPSGGACYRLFGPLPPSPATLLTHKSTSPDPDLLISGPETDPVSLMSSRVADMTRDKFVDNTNGILRGYLGAGYVGTPDAAAQYATSECLLIFLRTFSPQAKVITDRLGKAMTNDDGDSIVRNNQTQDLNELRDTWGNPVRYTVLYVGRVVGGDLYRWELRSAGADGKFADVDFFAATPPVPNPFS